MTRESDIIRDMSDGVITVNGDGTIQTINPAAIQILGFDEGAKDRTFAELLIGDSRNDAFVQAILDALGTEGAPASRVLDYYPSEGSLKKLSVKPTFDRSPDGQRQLIVVISDVTERENAVVHHRDAVILISAFFIFTCGFIFVAKALEPLIGVSISRSAITTVMLVVFLAATFIISKMVTMDLNPLHRGKPTRAAIMESLVVVGIIGVLMVAIKVVATSMGSTFFPSDVPFFNVPRVLNNCIFKLYPLSVLAQEYVARCVVQDSFIYSFGEKHGWDALLVSSLLFGTLHLHYSIGFMVMAFFLVGAIGIYYQRRRSLVGCLIIHFFLAEFAFGLTYVAIV